jgi:hypothetical protein
MAVPDQPAAGGGRAAARMALRATRGTRPPRPARPGGTAARVRRGAAGGLRLHRLGRAGEAGVARCAGATDRRGPRARRVRAARAHGDRPRDRPAPVRQPHVRRGRVDSGVHRGRAVRGRAAVPAVLPDRTRPDPPRGRGAADLAQRRHRPRPARERTAGGPLRRRHRQHRRRAGHRRHHGALRAARPRHERGAGAGPAAAARDGPRAGHRPRGHGGVPGRQRRPAARRHHPGEPAHAGRRGARRGEVVLATRLPDGAAAAFQASFWWLTAASALGLGSALWLLRAERRPDHHTDPHPSPPAPNQKEHHT